MPWEKSIIGARFSLRIDDFTIDDVLVVQCEGCGRTWRVCAAQMLAQFPRYRRIKDVAAQFRCRSCGATACTWHTERAVPVEV